MSQPVEDAVEARSKPREPSRQSAIAETKVRRDHLGPRLALWEEVHDLPFHLWQEPFAVRSVVAEDRLAVRLQDLQKPVVGRGNRDVQVVQLQHDSRVLLKVCDFAPEETRQFTAPVPAIMDEAHLDRRDVSSGEDTDPLRGLQISEPCIRAATVASFSRSAICGAG